MQDQQVVEREIDYQQLVLLAEVGYEAVRVLKKSRGQDAGDPWDKASPAQQESFARGALAVLQGVDPAEQHNAWVEHKKGLGWALGPDNAEAKTSPYLLPYAELPEFDRLKDKLFTCTVRAALEALVF